jgi:hypothetical protein
LSHFYEPPNASSYDDHADGCKGRNQDYSHRSPADSPVAIEVSTTLLLEQADDVMEDFLCFSQFPLQAVHALLDGSGAFPVFRELALLIEIEE